MVSAPIVMQMMIVSLIKAREEEEKEETVSESNMGGEKHERLHSPISALFFLNRRGHPTSTHDVTRKKRNDEKWKKITCRHTVADKQRPTF